MGMTDKAREVALAKAHDKAVEYTDRITAHGDGDPANPAVERMLDKLLTVQRPAVLANIRVLRKRRPNATPEQIITSLERQYLASVTAGGAAIGASAVIPGVGTGASIALSGVGAAGFLEASALFAQSVTEVHGIRLEDPDRARALVMTMMLGSAGTDLVRQVAGQALGRGPAMTSYWGGIITGGLPKFVVGELADRARGMFIRHFVAQQGAGIVGRALPFGIGAAIGGAGNAMLGRSVVQSSRGAFGPAPATFSDVFVVAPSRGERKKALAAGAAPAAYEPLRLFVRDYGGPETDGTLGGIAGPNGTAGKTAVLIHGIMADSRIWYEIAPFLIARGYRVLAPDLAGHGGSPRSRVYSPERWAADVRASLLQAPDLIIGHSLGGLVASHLVDEYLPARAIYVDPAFGEPGGIAGVISREHFQRLKPPTRAQLIKAHPSWSIEQIDMDVANLEHWDAETVHGVRDRAVVRAPEMPVVPSLVVLPRKSMLVSKQLAHKLGESGFAIRTVPGGGHELFRDDLQAFLKTIDDWL